MTLLPPVVTAQHFNYYHKRTPMENSRWLIYGMVKEKKHIGVSPHKLLCHLFDYWNVMIHFPVMENLTAPQLSNREQCQSEHLHFSLLSNQCQRSQSNNALRFSSGERDVFWSSRLPSLKKTLAPLPLCTKRLVPYEVWHWVLTEAQSEGLAVYKLWTFTDSLHQWPTNCVPAARNTFWDVTEV